MVIAVTKRKVMRKPRQKIPTTAPPIGAVFIHKDHSNREATIVKYGRPRGEFTYVYYKHDGSLAKTPNCASLAWFLEHYREGDKP